MQKKHVVFQVVSDGSDLRLEAADEDGDMCLSIRDVQGRGDSYAFILLSPAVVKFIGEQLVKEAERAS